MVLVFGAMKEKAGVAATLLPGAKNQAMRGGVSVKGGECGNKICELFFSVFTDYRFSICAYLRSVFFTIRSCLLLPFDFTLLLKFILI